MQNVTTTAGETFTADEHKQLARMIFKRFGKDLAAATVAWRRMLQNSTSEADFVKLIADQYPARAEAASSRYLLMSCS